MSLPIIQTIQNNINSLNSSKLDIKNAVNTDYDFIANEQIESYPSLIKQGIAHYKNRVPHATKEGTDLSFDAVPLKFENMTIKGDTSQDSTTGKNLLDASLLPITAYGLTISKDDSGNIVINGTPNYQEGYKSFTIGRQKTVDAGTYTMSIANKKVGLGINVGGFSGYLNITMADTVTSKTTTSNATYTIQGVINIRYDAGTFDNYIFNPMFELGSTATDYEPYTNGASPNPDYPQPIHVVTGNNTIGVQGKNLAGDETFIAINSSGDRRYGFKITKPGTYTLSYKKPQGSILYCSYKYYENGQYSEYQQAISPFTFTITQGQEAIIYNGTANKTLHSIGILDIQIELSSTATSYKPYYHADYPINLGSIELCKIGNYQDYLYKENGNWYKSQKVYKHLFQTGHQNLVVTGTNFYIPLTAMEVTPTRAPGYMKSYKYDSRASGFNNMANFYFGFENAGAVHIKNTNYSTGPEITEALINANEVLYYASNVVTPVQITDETLIAQLNAIDKAKGVDGTTIITIDSDDLKPILNFTAYLKEVE